MLGTDSVYSNTASVTSCSRRCRTSERFVLNVIQARFSRKHRAKHVSKDVFM